MPSNKKVRWSLYLISFMLHVCVLSWVKLDPDLYFLRTDVLQAMKVVLIGREIDPELIKILKRRQVVNNEFTGSDQLNTKNTFLGKKTQSYKQETIPRKIAPFSAGSSNKEVESQNEIMKGRTLHMSDLLIRRPKNIEAFATKTAQNHKTFVANISTGLEASNNDYIEGVKLGLATNLNTQEYMFWSFYHRIRLRLEPIWERLLDERIRKFWRFGKKIIIGNGAMTLIKITLDEEGNVFRIKVLNSSGIAEIDDVAIDAITLSGPFSSVPRAMLKDKLTEIDWGFVVRH